MQESIGLREAANQIFAEKMTEAISSSGIMLSIASSLVFVALIVMAIVMLYNSTTASPMEMFKRLINILLLLFLFTEYSSIISFIYNFYDQIGGAFVSQDLSWDELQNSITERREEYYEETDIVLDWFSINTDGLKTMVYLFMLEIVSFIMTQLSVIAFLFIKALSLSYLTILIVFGPLNISLSFFPVFGGLWKSWLQKLMNVALWIPILYLMDHFLLTIIKGVLDKVLTNEAGFSILLGSSLLFLMNFGVYLSAPFFSNFVFQGSQSNAKQLAASGKHYLKKGAKASGHMVSAKPNPVGTFRTLMQ